MASLQQTVPRKARESLLAVASATVAARQRTSVDWSDATNAIDSIASIPLDILNREQREIATTLLMHNHEKNGVGLDSALVISQLNAWMDTWLEHAGYLNMSWAVTMMALDKVVQEEAVDELSHLTDFVGYKEVSRLDDDLHYAIRKLRVCAA